MRDFPSFVETRQKLLQLKPGNRIHWLTFAVAHHINGNCELAVKILDEFENTVAGEEMSESEACWHPSFWGGPGLQPAGRRGRLEVPLRACTARLTPPPPPHPTQASCWS
jgi:hypothetical protein